MKITNKRQFEVLIEFMQEKPHLARGFSRSVNKVDTKGEWSSLAAKLNSLGPPSRDGDGWQKVWSDFKYKTKKKVVRNNQKKHATGGGPFDQEALSAVEEAVVDMLAVNDLVHPKGYSFGDPDQVILTEDVALTLPVPNHQTWKPTSGEEDLPTFSGYISELPPVQSTPKKKLNTKYQLLERQLLSNEKSLKEVNDKLSNIENCLRENTRINKKRLRVEEDMLSVLRKEEKREKKRKVDLMEQRFLWEKRNEEVSNENSETKDVHM